MAPSYYSTRSSRDHFIEPPSLLSRVIAGLPSELSAQIQRLWDRNSYAAVSTKESRIPRGLRHWTERWHPRRLLNLPHLLVLVWLLVLLWGERWVFESAIKTCEWGRWERWVSSRKQGERRGMKLMRRYSPKMQHPIIWSSLRIRNL